MLNASLLPIAWTRRWRALEVPAFLATAFYVSVWFDRYYAPAALGVTAVCALVFFVEFLALPVLRARRAGPVVLEQSILAVLNPALCLAEFDWMLWPDHRWSLTAVALGLSLAYLAVARAAGPVGSGGRSPTQLLFAGVALVLVTVAVPIRLEGSWIGWAWAAEGAALVWIGLRVDVRHMRTLGLVLLFFVSLAWIVNPPAIATFLWNARFGTAAVLVVSLVLVLRATRLYADRITAHERPWYVAAAILVNFIGVVGLTLEVHTYFLENEGGLAWPTTRLAEGLVVSLLWAICAAVLTLVGVRTRRAALRWQGLALFGLVAVKVFFVDLADLRGFYRITSAVAVGVLLLVVSFFYQRKTQRSRPTGESS